MGNKNSLRIIPINEREGKICNHCGTKLSVKYYGVDDKPYCNICIIKFRKSVYIL